MSARKPNPLLEPGVLLGGALFRDLLEQQIDPGLASGTRIGPFRIVSELGRGGMGVVYLAERDDGAFEQQVALKCMAERGSVAGSDLFVRERQILADLRHPHIARLLDGGRDDDGLLWFAMERVDGERIDRHCRARALPLDARLPLWMAAADAVQFAHLRLLIHRDIKPANVLIDRDGQPRLLDFGIAMLAGEDAGPRAYSPAWASPEQRAGASVGTASDQYQLGRLLAAMLESAAVTATDAPTAAASPASTHPVPFQAMAWIAMPAHRRRELTAVLQRACAKDPVARYGSVAELRADVQRVLDRQPIAIRQGDAFYAMSCALRRRPLTSLAAALAVIALLVLVIGFNMRLARERDVAIAETAKVQAINAFVSDDLLASANPFQVQGFDISVREALDRARDRVGTRFLDQPAIESELRLTLGATYAGIGELDEARRQLNLASGLRRGFERSDSDTSVRIRLLLAEAATAASDHAAALDQFDELIRDLTPLRRDRDPQLLAARLGRIEALGYLGRGEQALREDALLATSLEPMGSTAAIGFDHADVRAHLLLSLGRASEALAIFDATATRASAAFGAADHRTQRALEGQARALRDLGRPAEAVPLLQQLYQQRLAHFGREHRETLRNHNELAVALSRSGDRAAAIAIWNDDLEIKRRRLGASHASTLSTRYNLGNELIAANRHADAERTFRDLLADERAARGDSDPGALTTQMSLANAITRQDRPAEALRLLDQALESGRETLAARPELGILLGYRSRALAALQRMDEARADARKAIAAFTASVGAEHRRTRLAEDWLATLTEPSGVDTAPR